MKGRTRRTPRSRRSRGAALLMAIAAAGLLTAIAIEGTEVVQDETRLVEAFRDDFRARWAVRAPVAIAISLLREDKNAFTGLTGEWATVGEVLDLGGIEVRFRIRDESAKVNLNALASSNAVVRDGTSKLLKKIFEASDLETPLVDFLWDWVDADSDPRGPGAEGDYYRTLSKPYPAKNAPLDTLSELRLVRGFTPVVLEALGFRKGAGALDPVLSERLTLYSDGRINVNTADPLILRNLVDGLPDLFLDDLIERRKEEPIQSLKDLKNLPGMDDELFNRLAPLATVESKYFSLTSEAKAGRIRRRLIAVLKKETDRTSVVFWRIF